MAVKMSNQPSHRQALAPLFGILFWVTCGFAPQDSFRQLISAIESLDAQDRPSVDSLMVVSRPFFQSETDSIRARVNLTWARYYNTAFRYDSARHFAEEAVALFQQTGQVREEALARFFLGHLCYDVEDISSAISQYHKALFLFEELGMSKYAADAYNGVANSYCYIVEYSLALENYEKALELHRANSDSIGVAKVLGNMASLYTTRKEYDRALEYYEKALKWSVSDARQRMDHILGIGIVKEETGVYDGAEAYYREAVSLARELKDHVQLAYTYQNLAFLYIKTGQLDSVPKYLELTRQLKDKYSIIALEANIQEINHEYLYKRGQYQQAYEVLLSARAQSDSFYDLDMTRQLQEVQAQYGALRSEKELAQKDLDLERASGEIARNQFQRNSLIVGLLLVLVLVGMIFRSRRQKDKANRLLTQKNEQIEAKNKEIKAIEESKSRWFINISHELRTPLTLIKGPVRQALESIPANDPVYKDLKMADRNVAQLQKLVDEILDISKMEDGKMPLHLGHANFTEMVLNALATFDSAARALKIKLEMDMSPGEKVVVWADGDKINNVLNNLMSNALKFTHEGGCITVGLRKAAGEVHLFVKDTGDGIPPGDLHRIFDRFYQSDTSGSQGGTGVGLALCKEIARMHGGELTAVSELGKGSCFELILPLKEPGEVSLGEEVPMEHLVEEVREGYQAILRDRKVLIVEDNPDMREYIAGFLRSSFEIVEARDGVEGLEMLTSHVPDVIVSDVMMPRMDGATFATRVKEHPRWRNIPFVTVSAISDEAEKLKTLRIGIDDYLVKPFFAEELLVRIQNLIINYSERVSSQEEVEEEEISFEEKTLKNLEKEVYAHIDDITYNVARLAEAASMSERQLYRYIRQMTGLTPANFIKEIRMQKAMELIQKRVYKRTSQLSYAVGFQQPAYFSSVFKKRFGRLPAEYIEG